MRTFLQEPSVEDIQTAITSNSLKPRNIPKFRLTKHRSQVPDPSYYKTIQTMNQVQTEYLQQSIIPTVNNSKTQIQQIAPTKPEANIDLQTNKRLQNFLKQYFYADKTLEPIENQMKLKFSNFGVGGNYRSQHYDPVDNMSIESPEGDVQQLPLIPQKLFIDVEKIKQKQRYELDRINQPGYKQMYGQGTFIGHLPSLKIMRELEARK